MSCTPFLICHELFPGQSDFSPSLICSWKTPCSQVKVFMIFMYTAFRHGWRLGGCNRYCSSFPKVDWILLIIFTHTQIYEKSFLDTQHLWWWSHSSQKYVMKRLQAAVTSCNKEYSNCEKSINYIQWAWLSTGTGPIRLWDLHSWTSSWLDWSKAQNVLI